MSITFRKDFRLYWPDYDAKPERCHAYVMRHLRDMDHAVRLCPKKRTCVQAGGHAGLWPIRLSRYFETVHTFEPEPALFQCLRRNVDTSGQGNKISCWEEALGAVMCATGMKPHSSAGSWTIDDAGSVSVSMRTIDSIAMRHCDAIFLDIEGYEVEALMGAADTIERCRPIIHVEELPRAQGRTSLYLTSIGYRNVHRIGKDSVWVHEKKRMT